MGLEGSSPFSNSSPNLENEFDTFNKKPLRLKIIKKGKKKYSIGINLNFNSLKNISKIKYSEEAPNHREAKDGLNFLCYCVSILCNKDYKFQIKLVISNY